MQGHASTLRFNDSRRQPHHLPCSKSGQQGDVFETVLFAVTVTIHPSIDRVFECDPACIVSAKGPPFAMILSSIFICPAITSMTIRLVSFLKTLERTDRLSPFSDLAAMDAGVSTKGLRVAGVPIGDGAWVHQLRR